MGHRASAAVVIAFIAACGDPDQHVGDRPDAGADTVDAAPADAEAAVTLFNVCAPDGAVAELFGRLVECNPAFDIVFLQGRLGPTEVSALCNGAFGPYVTDGSIALPSREQLEACAAYLDDTDCVDVELSLSIGPCDVLIGQVPSGEACEIDDQCEVGTYCDTGGAGPCGVCAASQGDGTLCTSDVQCAGKACIGSQCGVLGDDGDPCFEDADCIGQRICDPDTNQCAKARTWQVNDVCVPGTGDCDPITSGLWCRDNGSFGQCVPLLSVTQLCRENGIDLGVCNVFAYATCPAGSDAACVGPTLQTTEDDPCGLFSGEQCAPGLACTDVVNGGVCIDYQGAGETCDVGPGAAETDRCDLFLGCLDDGVTSSCVYSAYSGACPP
jgi:hypothetical protein